MLSRHVGQDAVGDLCEVGNTGRTLVRSDKPAVCSPPDPEDTFPPGLGGGNTICKLCGNVVQSYNIQVNEPLPADEVDSNCVLSGACR
jgi:hypothetical protein